MNSTRIVFGMTLCLFAGMIRMLFSPVTAADPPHEVRPPTTPELRAFVADRKTALLRVTERPFVGDLINAGLCRAPLPVEDSVKNPHLSHYIHVYVTPSVKETILSGQGDYPVGTVILKEKLNWPGPLRLTSIRTPEEQAKVEAQTPELFTGMLKRESGYHPECGDWEFFVVSGDARQMLARGKIDSCVECHRDYKATDFVTRTYLPAAK